MFHHSNGSETKQPVTLKFLISSPLEILWVFFLFTEVNNINFFKGWHVLGDILTHRNLYFLSWTPRLLNTWCCINHGSFLVEPKLLSFRNSWETAVGKIILNWFSQQYLKACHSGWQGFDLCNICSLELVRSWFSWIPTLS